MLLLIEIFWTAISVVGLVVSIWAIIDAVHDLIWVDKNKIKEPRRKQAVWNIQTEAFRLYIHLAALLVGAIALLVPNDPGDFEISWRRILTLFFLVSLELAVVVNTVQTRRQRLALIQYDLDHGISQLEEPCPER